VLVFSLPVVLTLGPVVDNDLWWHLRTGQWIAQHKTVPATDPFSSYAQDKPWVAYSWLFGLLMYRLHQGMGLWGIYLYRLLMWLAITLAVLLLARRQNRYIFTCGITGFAICALVPLMQERSWLFSILFYAVTLAVILDVREGKPNRLGWFLPFVYALWANLHIEFVVGLALLGLACAAPLLDRFYLWMIQKRESTIQDRASGRNDRDSPSPADHPFSILNSQSSILDPRQLAWRPLVLLTVLCALATLINPYGIKIYQPVLELPTQRSVYSLVAELKPLPFRKPSDWAVLALAMTAAFRLGQLAARSQLASFEVLLLASSAYFSFQSQREIWLVVLAAVAIVAIRKPTPEPGFSDLKPVADVRFRFLDFSLVAGAVALVTLLAIRTRGVSEEYLDNAVAKAFPVQAAAFVERQNYPGPLANHFDWGGYLIWRLPGHPVSIDGRCNLHTDERIVRSFETWSGSPGWETDPDLVAARLIIGQVSFPLVAKLKRDPDLELVYEDSVAAVFIRHNPELKSARKWNEGN
jgi:hypothetical protein